MASEIARHGRSATVRRRFATYHPADRAFFLAFVLACWLGIIMGFVPAAMARWAGKANFPAPLILQLHAISFVGWLVLFTFQLWLIRIKRHQVHMMLGLLGVLLVPLMLVSGLVSEQITQRFHFDGGEPNLAFFIVPLFYLAGFALFVIPALLLRRKPAIHKRLMLLATAVVVGPGYGRWLGDALFEAVGDDFWGMIVNTFSGTNLLLVAAATYDLATRGRIHPVLAGGMALVFLGELVTSAIYHSPLWPPVAQAWIGR